MTEFYGSKIIKLNVLVVEIVTAVGRLIYIVSDQSWSERYNQYAEKGSCWPTFVN